MVIVIDASVMAAQLLRDEEHSSLAQILLEQLDTDDLIVPRIFWYEIRNVLLKAKQSKRIEQQDFEACLLQLTDEFSPTEDAKNDEAKTLDLAERHNLTVYDAQLSRDGHPSQGQAGDLRPKTRYRRRKRKNREPGDAIGCYRTPKPFTR